MTEQQAIQKLAVVCGTAEHCSHDMRERMKKWEMDEEAQQQVLDYLIREKYVDDARYARLFVKEKLRLNKWGRKKIEQSLLLKRIPKAICTEVLDEVADEEYAEILKPLLRQKAKSVKASTEYGKTMKLIHFALQRGYTYDVIKRCLEAEIEGFDED